MNANEITRELEKSGFCIDPNFLSPPELLEVQRDFDTIKGEGRFHRAGVGHAHNLAIHDDIRRDQIYWLEQSEANSVQNQLWEKIEALKQSFNMPPFYMGISQFQGHYSSYAEGAYYKRHFDNSTTGHTRVVSLVVYLNGQWKAEDGGELRLFHDDLRPDAYTQLLPTGGTMVCFMSRDFEHEVRTCRVPRRSFSGWFKTE